MKRKKGSPAVSAFQSEEAEFKKIAKAALKRKKGAAGKAQQKKEDQLLKIKTQLEVFKTKPKPAQAPDAGKKPRVKKLGVTKTLFTKNVKKIKTSWLQLRAFELYRSANLASPYYYQLYSPISLSGEFQVPQQRALQDATTTRLARLQRGYPTVTGYASRTINSTEEQPKYLRDYHKNVQALELGFRSRSKYFRLIKATKNRPIPGSGLITNQNLQSRVRSYATGRVRFQTPQQQLPRAAEASFGLLSSTGASANKTNRVTVRVREGETAQYVWAQSKSTNLRHKT